ncbi:MAG TPA: DUF6306 domain-containing protein [Spirochaetota bacterium]|nr:DUF6306 domain-containing protein [Spirochaetota bacterium]HPJ44341.1 DUF6306 domain-containing protein [Spirochaetota bacterium]HPR39373.1 DUF6306 domain-containing protein [Spirochaetota bacterium]
MKNKNIKELADFYRKILEAERAGVQSINEIISTLEDGELKSMMSSYLRDEGMNCQILISLIKNMNEDPGSKTGDFVEKIRALSTLEEKLALLIKGQEWVAKQIRYNRHLMDAASSLYFMEAMKVQHEENVDRMKRVLEMQNS